MNVTTVKKEYTAAFRSIQSVKNNLARISVKQLNRCISSFKTDVRQEDFKNKTDGGSLQKS